MPVPPPVICDESVKRRPSWLWWRSPPRRIRSQASEASPKLENCYRRRFDMALAPLARAIEGQLCEYFATGPHIDRVTARPKSVERFLAKAQTYEHEKLKYRIRWNRSQSLILGGAV
jgi:hypothetical protein